ISAPSTVPSSRAGPEANTAQRQLPVAPQSRGTRYSGPGSPPRSSAQARSAQTATPRDPSFCVVCLARFASSPCGSDDGAVQSKSMTATNCVTSGLTAAPEPLTVIKMSTRDTRIFLGHFSPQIITTQSPFTFVESNLTRPLSRGGRISLVTSPPHLPPGDGCSGLFGGLAQPSAGAQSDTCT